MLTGSDEGYNISAEPSTLTKSRNRVQEVSAGSNLSRLNQCHSQTLVSLVINRWKVNCNQHFFPSKSSPAQWCNINFLSTLLCLVVYLSHWGETQPLSGSSIQQNELSVTLCRMWVICLYITVTLTVVLIWPKDYSGDVWSCRSRGNPSCFKCLCH